MAERIRYGDHDEQFGELRQPPGSDTRPLVVLIHGGFWRDQYRHDLMNPLADALAARGYASWNIEYRRVGPTGGGFPQTLEDVRAAIDHDLGQVWPASAVIGHSAGGHLALWNASDRGALVRPTLTVALAAVTDVIVANRTGVGVDATANFFGGDVDDVPERYDAGQPDPAAFAGRVVALHGDQDDSVPLAQAHLIEDSIDRLYLLEGVDHFDVIDPNHECWAIVNDELEALTKRSGRV